MNNTLVLLRHGKTKVDKDVPISQWILSDVGIQQAQAIAQNDYFQDVDVVIVSGEGKAFETAKPLAEKLGKQIMQMPELSELDRDKGGFMDSETYEKTVQKCLSNPDISVSNWETASHALERFSKKIEDINRRFEDKKILIVGHGYTINMYFAKLLGEMDKVYERLAQNDFCDWGVIRDDKVIKDLGQDIGRVDERLV